MTIDPDSDPYQSGVVHYKDGTDRPLGEVNGNRIGGAIVKPEDVPAERRLGIVQGELERYLAVDGNHESFCRSHAECCGRQECECNLAPLYRLIEQ